MVTQHLETGVWERLAELLFLWTGDGVESGCWVGLSSA